MRGYEEEIYWSQLRIGEIMEILSHPFEKVIAQYLHAYQFRPCRIEPLYSMARMYRKNGGYAKAYQLCQIALSMPETEDHLFVCQWMSDYGLLVEKSVSAYWLGKYEECRAISLELLKCDSLPQNVKECLLRNLGYANAKLVESVCSLSENHRHEDSRPLLITGCARSGTGYISKLMTRCGLDIGHEAWGKDGCSSWVMAVDDENPPWGESSHNVQFDHVFHQVRHPLKVISSVYSTEPETSWNYISKHIPEIKREDSHLVKCAKYWYYWNLKAQEKAEFTYRVEDIDNALKKMGQLLHNDLDNSAISLVSDKTNTRPHSREFSWKDLEKELPKDLLKNIQNLASSYGY
jgi:hypothetical protein